MKLSLWRRRSTSRARSFQRLQEGAADRARVAEPIIAETACVLSSDRDEVMTAVRRNMEFYLAMPVYRALFERIGLIDSGWSSD